MNKKNLDIAYFLSFCIEQYKEAKHLHGAEAAKIFSQYGVLKYLEEHFESLHSQSRQWILEDIDEFINVRKRNGMNLNVTQDNLYLFLPSKISWMAERLSEEKTDKLSAQKEPPLMTIQIEETQIVMKG